MANLGLIGQQIAQGFNQGFNRGLEEELATQRALKQQQAIDKYVGQQVANMLLEKEKQTEEYAKAQTKQKGLLDTQTALQNKMTDLDKTSDVLQPLLDTQSLLQKNNIIPFGSQAGENVSNMLAADRTALDEQIEKNQTAISSIEDYLNNPLSKANRQLYDLAMGGNTFATQEIKDMLYPEYEYNINTREVFDKDTQKYRTITDLIGRDKQGNIKIKNLFNDVSGQDYTLNKLAALTEKERIKAGAKGSGTDEKSPLSADKLNELRYMYDLANNPELDYIVADMRKTGDSGLIEPILKYGTMKPQPMPDKTLWQKLPFTESYDEAVERVNKENRQIEMARQYLKTKYKYDPYIVYANDGIAKIQADGGNVYQDENGNYVLVSDDGTEQIVTLDDIIDYGLY